MTSERTVLVVVHTGRDEATDTARRVTDRGDRCGLVSILGRMSVRHRSYLALCSPRRRASRSCSIILAHRWPSMYASTSPARFASAISRPSWVNVWPRPNLHRVPFIRRLCAPFTLVLA